MTQPWSLAFLPNGDILVTERVGKLRIVRNGVLDPNPVGGDVRQGPDGLLYLLTAENDGALMRIEPAGAPASPGAR